ncbi:MAG TPA: hypothetical protein V6D07_14345 [Trichocoleus sp.]
MERLQEKCDRTYSKTQDAIAPRQDIVPLVNPKSPLKRIVIRLS